MATSLVRCGGRFVKIIYFQNLIQRQLLTHSLPCCVLCGFKIDTSGIINQTAVSHQSSRYSTAVQEDEELDVLYKGLDIELKGHDPRVLESYTTFVDKAAKELDVNIQQLSTPPKTIRRTSLLKSVHVYKKHFVQYESRTHYKLIEIQNVTGSTADTFLEYIQRNLPEGVMMKVTKCRLEKIPDHIKPPTS